MLKKVLFLGISIALFCNGFFALTQSAAVLNTDEGYVINSEMIISLRIFSTEELFPEAVHEFSISYDSNLMEIDSAKGFDGVTPLSSQMDLRCPGPGGA